MSTLIDSHEIIARIAGREVEVIDASLTLDRGWAPYVQGTLTIRDPQIRGLLDPRQRPRVHLQLTRRYSASRTLGYLSTQFAGQTIAAMSAAWTGKTLGQVSALYREVWNPGGRWGSDEPLAVSSFLTGSRRRLSEPDLWEISFQGGEYPLQTRASETMRWTSQNATVRGLVNDVLARFGYTPLQPGTANATVEVDEDGEGPVWEAGVTVWDYLNPIVQAAELRLYCDENHLWQLVGDDANAAGSHDLGPEAIECEDSWSADGRFFDGAILIYEWETRNGTAKKALDTYKVGKVATYVEHIAGKLTRPGRAKRIVTRAVRRALAQTWESVADYQLRPGQKVTLPAGETGRIDSITWTYPDARMTVQVIDVTTPAP
ncbi:hypothetical protein JOF28_001969 [Leucobacter exalbidus]|uniref:Uncharacterized protein n=1 Tax=Leucobacter exalbidus TaxID=662960 RepID=A0A940PMM2_9MICO|nr:hypothetical protein [Leucobacter exalbidus]MBP1326737.1 hypothetical protein [Leucobacter exalbidus]